LQQLDVLADYGTKSYIVGSTNSLLLQQRDRYSDILINLDEDTINITSTSLRAALTLSAADRRWIDFITQSVNETWDDANPQRPKTMGYVGSEEFIRLQFEEYLLSALSSVKCHNYLQHHANNPSVMLPQVDGDPANDFGVDWIEAWSHSENYRIWNMNTDSHLFDIVEPKHPCAGGLTIDDVQRRIAEQVKDLHLDERFAVSKEVIGKNLEAGREKIGTVFNKLYSDMEALRESQRKRQEEHKREQDKLAAAQPQSPLDLNGTKSAQSKVSWGAWLGEKKKIAFGRSSSTNTSPTIRKENEKSAVTTPVQLESARRKSYNENIFEADESHMVVPQEVETGPIKPSRFHEDIDDTSQPIPVPRKSIIDGSTVPAAIVSDTAQETASAKREPSPERVPEVVSEESKAWGDAAASPVDRSQAVADALATQSSS